MRGLPWQNTRRSRVGARTRALENERRLTTEKQQSIVSASRVGRGRIFDSIVLADHFKYFIVCVSSLKVLIYPFFETCLRAADVYQCARARHSHARAFTSPPPCPPSPRSPPPSLSRRASPPPSAAARASRRYARTRTPERRAVSIGHVAIKTSSGIARVRRIDARATAALLTPLVSRLSKRFDSRIRHANDACDVS